MGKDKVRIGIIGAGRIGKIHADNLLRNPHAEIVESVTYLQVLNWRLGPPVVASLL